MGDTTGMLCTQDGIRVEMSNVRIGTQLHKHSLIVEPYEVVALLIFTQKLLDVTGRLLHSLIMLPSSWRHASPILI